MNIQALRDRKTVVLNLTRMNPDQAQRAVDFIAGSTKAISGHQERIGESIFLFTPICVQVTTQLGVVHEAPLPQVRTQRTTVEPAMWLFVTVEGVEPNGHFAIAEEPPFGFAVPYGGITVGAVSPHASGLPIMPQKELFVPPYYGDAPVLALRVRQVVPLWRGC